MPNLDPWINQNSNYEEMTTNTINKFENHLLSIKAEHQQRIRPNLHPTYNESHQKIIEMVDWTLERYRTVKNIRNNQQNDQQEQAKEEVIIIDIIIKELNKKEK